MHVSCAGDEELPKSVVTTSITMTIDWLKLRLKQFGPVNFVKVPR